MIDRRLIALACNPKCGRLAAYVLGSMQMNAIAKFGIATLVAIVLLLTPICFCADVLMPPGTPAHPCCPAKPASLPDDCARPGCIYMDTSVTPLAVAATNDGGPVCESEPGAIWMEKLPAVTAGGADSLSPLPPYERFVVFHQFLI